MMTARDRMMHGDPIEEQDPEADAADRMLTALYDKLSAKMAGGQRTDPRLIMPGGGVLELEEGGRHATEGFFPEEYRPDAFSHDWFRPEMFVRASQMDDPRSELDLAAIKSATGPGRDGKGMDWFRAGEAPNNYANRNNPLYKARTEFTIAVDDQIEDMFDVQGASGHYRAPDPSHAAPGGPSANSDHYSAGAVDYFGSTEELTRLRNWLVEQPWVSFVRWQSESHYDHVHVSVDLGWVAENYFGGGEVPTLAGPGEGPEATHTQMREQTAPELPESQTVEDNTVPDPNAGGTRVL